MIENYHYTDKEIDQIINSMVILVDKREKENSHILNYFDKKKISYINKSLSQGDYSFYIPKNESLSILRDYYFDNQICIERKASLEELSGNFTQQRDRFEKELSLCKAKLILMIENANYSDIIEGKYNTQYNKKSYWASLHSFWFKYNLPFMFIPNNDYSGVFIRGVFTYYLKNVLH